MPAISLLFSIYAEMMMKQALEIVEEGITVGGKLIKDVNMQMIKEWLPIQKPDYRT